MTDPSTHLFWITSRAAGTAGMVLSSASVTVGLTMGGKLIKRRVTDRRTIQWVSVAGTAGRSSVAGTAALGRALPARFYVHERPGRLVG